AWMTVGAEPFLDVPLGKTGDRLAAPFAPLTQRLQGPLAYPDRLTTHVASVARRSQRVRQRRPGRSRKPVRRSSRSKKPSVEQSSRRRLSRAAALASPAPTSPGDRPA